MRGSQILWAVVLPAALLGVLLYRRIRPARHSGKSTTQAVADEMTSRGPEAVDVAAREYQLKLDYNWSELEHANGPADDIPEILAALSPHTDSEIWHVLWSQLCHQGDVYSASFAALNELRSAAARWPAAARVAPLILAASIVYGAGRSRQIGQMLRLSASDIAIELENLSRETLSARELSENDVIYLMQAVMLLEDNHLWGQKLDHLIDGEFPGICTSCRQDFYIVIGDQFFVTAEDWVKRTHGQRTAIAPCDPSQLTGAPHWLRETSIRCGQTRLTQRLEHTFGSARCPRCGAEVSLPEAIALGVY